MPRSTGSFSPLIVPVCTSNHQEFRLGCFSGGGPVAAAIRWNHLDHLPMEVIQRKRRRHESRLGRRGDGRRGGPQRGYAVARLEAPRNVDAACRAERLERLDTQGFEIRRQRRGRALRQGLRRPGRRRR